MVPSLRLLALPIVLLAASAAADPPFHPGEELTYRVEALGLSAGHARISVGAATQREGTAAWPIVIWARTDSIFDAIYTVRDKFVSWWDPEAGRLLGTELYQDEGGRRQRERYKIAGGKARVQSERDGSPARQAEYTVPLDVTDVTSALMSLRGHQLEPGKEVVLPVFLGSRVVQMQCSVGGRQRITTPAGTFETVSALLHTGFGGQFASRSDVRIWFTDDPAHVPVQLEADLVLGKLVIQLVDYKKGVTVALSEP